METNSKSLNLHKVLHGKLSVEMKTEIENFDDLSLVYTPGVADVCMEIFHNPSSVNDLQSNQIQLPLSLTVQLFWVLETLALPPLCL